MHLEQRTMAVEGVMVSYNYSEDGELANILTVAASGIKFSNRWVLTHGSILSPLKQVNAIQNAKGKPILSDEFYDNLPEIHVTCEKEQSKAPNLYEGVERLSRERSLDNDADDEHSSYQIRVLTGRICHVWQCPILERCVADILYSWTVGYRDGDIEKQTQLGKALLSVFVLVDLESENRGLKTLRPLSELFDMVRPPPGRGSTVEVHSTPFGCEVFLNAVTRGTVCGVVGKRPSLLLTDAATALGSEGGPVFTEGPTGSLWGAVVCSVSWWRGEWVGLTLTAPLVSVLAAKLRVTPPAINRPMPTSPHKEILDRIDKTTVLVRCGAAWGAGLYLGGGYVVTCAHVVKNYGTYKISLYCQGVKETAIVRYKTADDKAYDLALLYTNPQYWNQLIPAEFADEPAEKGESVLAAGYPYFNETNLEDLKPTVTSGHINNASPSMIQTSCCVQSGFSGGPIFRLTKTNSVEVLGIIVSNAKTETGACYPYINMAVPTRAFIHLLHNFMQDKDAGKLRIIENDKEIVQSQWRLMPYRSKI
ncbi:peroxisomal leader peptide-processing protease isoform X2 [Pectinophora gossypiella]|uniref:peroxisomal leader peptide-processing protease isoform X2 n=1 Tax=Pectinophora gossypiella TaxID=13191 RepID=UPI00214EEE37|nr:peroxisomal leader peptide-processing protease isoform X2 [Pectinophora gossypiella]